MKKTEPKQVMIKINVSDVYKLVQACTLASMYADGTSAKENFNRIKFEVKRQLDKYYKENNL